MLFYTLLLLLHGLDRNVKLQKKYVEAGGRLTEGAEVQSPF